jgi:hypothetical protein
MRPNRKSRSSAVSLTLLDPVPTADSLVTVITHLNKDLKSLVKQPKSTEKRLKKRRKKKKLLKLLLRRATR